MRDNPKILREIVEQTFSWEDLNPNRFNVNVMLNSNIFCPFHENKQTPAAKAFMDEDKGIVTIWCFNEQKRYTTYDYVDRIIVQQQHRYLSVQQFLMSKLGEQKFNELYTLAEQESYLENESIIEQTIEYIDNLYSEHDNVIDFINCLYLEK